MTSSVAVACILMRLVAERLVIKPAAAWEIRGLTTKALAGSIARRTAKVCWSLVILSILEAVGVGEGCVMDCEVGEGRASREFLKRSS